MRALSVESQMFVPALCALADAGGLERIISHLTARQWESLAFAALLPTRATPLLAETNHATSSRALCDALQVINGSRQLRAITASSRLKIESNVALRAVAALAMIEAA